jgi:FkbM family methyltransferase
MANIKREDIIWELKPYLRIGQTSQHEFNVWLNKPLSDWDVFDYWEKERTRSMVKHLNNGDILFDVGAEMGWLSVIYGQIVGPSNMVLIEPTKEFWGNIRAIWEKNFDCPPLATYAGLISDKNTQPQVLPFMNKWTPQSKGDLIDKLAYTYIHDNPTEVPEITIDDYVRHTGIVPNAITIDVEGAELLVLKGAKHTLIKHDIQVWVSEHDDLAENQGIGKYEASEFMAKLGYKRDYLGKDHEHHVRYYQ